MSHVPTDTALDNEPRQRVIGVLLMTVYAGVASSAVICTHSVSGWFVLGLAPVLLFDKFTFRLLSPTGPESRIILAGIRGGYFTLGANAIYFMHDGSVSRIESIYVGVVLSLSTFLFEYFIEWCFWMVSWLRGTLAFKRNVNPLHTAALGVIIAAPLVVMHPLMAVHPVRRIPLETPAKLGLKYDDVTIHTADGARLAAWYVPCDKPRGSVIYCHGYGENRGQAVPLLGPLQEMRLNVLAFDFRGHGDSSGHTVTFGHREVHDMQAALAEAKRRCPDKPVLLVGISYGATVALQSLPELPGVAGVWVDSTFAQLSEAMNNSFSFLPDAVRPALVTASEWLVRADCGFWSSHINLIERIEGLRVPIYFCHGKSDSVTPFEQGKSVYDAYQGPKWRYWIHDGTNRAMSRPARKEYFRRLQRFVERRLEQ